MPELFSSAQVQRACDAVYLNLLTVVHRGRVARAAVLDATRGKGRRVDIWLHAASETDLFGEQVRCLFRDRLIDLVQRGVLAYRGAVEVFTRRSVYEMRHVPTRVPVNLFVVRTDEAWAELQP